MEAKPEPSPPDSGTTIQYTVVGGQPYKLINAPGFDDPSKGNPEVFMDIARYLQNEEKSGVKGLIYIHNAYDPLRSKSLAENLNVLFNVILGQTALSSLTILVVPFLTADMEYAKYVAAKLQTTDSAFSAAHKANARIITCGFEEAEIHNIIRTSATNDFISLRIQGERPDNLLQSIEQALGYSSAGSLKAALARQEETTIQAYHPDLVAARKRLEIAEKALDEHRQSLAETKQSAGRYQDAYKQIEMQLGTEQKRTQDLSRRLQEAQSGYTSLRSHLQIRDNVEQSEIVVDIEKQRGVRLTHLRSRTRQSTDTHEHSD